MNYDIFISYRRQDAEAHACMLYRDLTDAGYTVFFDHKTLGSGDFIDNIRKAIDSCNDFLILLSHDALGERIYDPEDIVHQEIAYALRQKKQIVGIMLSGFDHFPGDLPEDIAEVSRINCLYGKMEYYEAMLERLLSGRFLLSVPGSPAPEPSAPEEHVSKEDALSWFATLETDKKQQYMQFLLNLAHEFNSSEPILRLYNYLDLYDRNRGLSVIPPYDGVIPTDYVTYLCYFETIYLIVKTRTIDISLLDELYRFRFFAACNNPVVQESELLAVGYQYPNVLDLYDYWTDYIISKHQKSGSTTGISEEIPQFERDLHATYRLYRFANNPRADQTIRFINKKFERLELRFHRLGPADLQEALGFETDVVSGIPRNDEQNIFETITEEQLCFALQHDICIGAYRQGELAGLLVLLPSPTEAQNLLLDLPQYRQIPQRDILIFDGILVAEDCRGYGLQRAFLRLTDFIAEKLGIHYTSAVVSPRNPYSMSNMIRSGYSLVGNFKKYHSTRNYFVKELKRKGE